VGPTDSTGGAPQKSDGPLTRSSFSARGLSHEDDLTDLFVGNFADVTFDRGSFIFSHLFEMYLEAYSRHCGASLPANKVEMTARVCAEGPAPARLPWEPEPSPHACSVWSTVSLGFADPALYAAKRQLDVEQVVSQMKDIFSVTNLTSRTIDANHVTADTDALVQRYTELGGK
jgi:hypothetical protein